MRRPTVAAAACAMALVLSAVLAGAAAAEVRSVYRSPAADEVVKAARPTIEGFVYMAGVGQQRVVLTLTALDDPERRSITRETIVNPGGRTCVPFSFTLDRPLDYNGRYTAVVTAPGAVAPPLPPGQGSDCSAAEESRDFFMAAPPVAPSEVKGRVEGRHVLLSWAKNPEPDVTRYRVLRAKGNGPFEPVGETRSLQFTASAPEAGDYRFHVVALRRGAKATDPLVASEPSGAVTANLPPPPAVSRGGSAPGPAARRSGGGRPAIQRSRPSTPPDTGFSRTLPFGEAPPEFEEGEEEAMPPPGFEEIGVEEERSDDQRNLAVLAAGLLVTVLVMHLLWIKGEVDREPLEAMTPE